jgi:hypothetical protein
MLSAALYAHVRILLPIAHETAGAARIRHSLLPHFFEGDNEMKTSGRSCRENADAHQLFEKVNSEVGSSHAARTSTGVRTHPALRARAAERWAFFAARRGAARRVGA